MLEVWKLNCGFIKCTRVHVEEQTREKTTREGGTKFVKKGVLLWRKLFPSFGNV